MTFSIVARCPKSGQFGAAVASSSPAVAARCIFVRAGVGAAASQNITDPMLGPRILDLMQDDATPAAAILATKECSPHIEYRQLMAIDATSTPVIFTGSSALGVLASVVGKDAACAGNMLSSVNVPAAMLSAFESTTGALAERLMQAMLAGISAGGEAGPIHSAGLLVADKLSWPLVDLRHDWVENDPIGMLFRTWQVYAPQANDYVARALDPRSAPNFGVPGNP